MTNPLLCFLIRQVFKITKKNSKWKKNNQNVHFVLKQKNKNQLPNKYVFVFDKQNKKVKIVIKHVLTKVKINVSFFFLSNPCENYHSHDNVCISF